jgi:hypothetical protein
MDFYGFLETQVDPDVIPDQYRLLIDEGDFHPKIATAIAIKIDSPPD